MSADDVKSAVERLANDTGAPSYVHEAAIVIAAHLDQLTEENERLRMEGCKLADTALAHAQRATKAEAERDEANEARAILQQAVLERTRERDEALAERDEAREISKSLAKHYPSGQNAQRDEVLTRDLCAVLPPSERLALLARSAQGGSDA